jgi:N-acetylglucosaminyl-diphospho-decaprenol L-rhamnosyltransferase
MTGGDETSEAAAPEIAVVTVAYRSDDVLPGFLGSVLAASSNRLLSVVVDNRPDEESKAAQTAHLHGSRYIALPANPGYGGAMNAGVATLPPSVRWVLISNPDVVLTAGVVDALVAAGESDDRIASIGPAVLNVDGTVYPSARRVPSLRTGIGHALFVNLWNGNPWTRRYRHDADTLDTTKGGTELPTARDAGWLSGACLLVRRDVFDTVGGFDEGYFMYFEDVDLGYRLGKAGYRNRYEPSVAVTHVGGHTAAPDSAQMIRAHHTSARRFVTRKYAAWYWWPVRSALSTGLALRSALVQRRAHDQRGRLPLQ